jgi:hypothetical protein
MQKSPFIVYESPDGGKTVFARHVGSSERRTVKQGTYEEWNGFALRYDWDGLAERHPAILEQLERLKVLVELCNK